MQRIMYIVHTGHDGFFLYEDPFFQKAVGENKNLATFIESRTDCIC